jgi:hypothetical protein
VNEKLRKRIEASIKSAHQIGPVYTDMKKLSGQTVTVTLRDLYLLFKKSGNGG